MTTICFEILGAPTGKGRPRACIRGTHAGTYTPDKTVNAEQSILAQALPYKPASPLTGPITVRMVAYMPIPKWTPKKREQAIAGEIKPTTKPDLDNIAKLVIDALNGVFFADDKQIVGLAICKDYSLIPRVKIAISDEG
jgi:Holliday junction resolvase RusA-like endonuclease